MKKLIKNRNGASLLITMLIFNVVILTLNLVVTQSAGEIRYDDNLEHTDWIETFHLEEPSIVDYVLFIPRAIIYGLQNILNLFTLDYQIIQEMGFFGDIIQWTYQAMLGISIILAIFKA